METGQEQVEAVANFVDADGRPCPLHTAAYSGDEKSLTTLLKDGVSANKLDASKSAALHYAALQGQLKCVKPLLKYDADVNIKDAEGTFLRTLQQHQRHSCGF
jgi:ankyrin repeat protein